MDSKSLKYSAYIYNDYLCEKYIFSDKEWSSL
jgi:hypothetical protein